MLPDVGATELMIIAAVALIVVGPKDLPVLMRKVGQFLARMRGMAAEFRASFDEMARQSELDELRKEVQALRTGAYATDTQAALGASSAEVDEVFHEIERDLQSPPDPDYGVDPWAAAPEPEPAPAPKAKKAAAPKKAAATPKKAAAPKKPAAKTPAAKKAKKPEVEL